MRYVLLLMILSGCVGIYVDDDQTTLITPVGPITEKKVAE